MNETADIRATRFQGAVLTVRAYMEHPNTPQDLIRAMRTIMDEYVRTSTRLIEVEILLNQLNQRWGPS